MSRARLLLISVAMLAGLPIGGAGASAEDFLLIAHPGVSLHEVPRSELTHILKGRTTQWEDGKRLVLVTLSPDAPGSDKIMRAALGLTAIQAKKLWLTEVFNGTLESAPPSLDSVDDVVDRVVSTPGSLALIPVGSPTGKAKVLKLLP